ncbi:MAG: type IV secretion system DNA-binding domain-containing protein [Candidatus Binataceae bacterium]
MRFRNSAAAEFQSIQTRARMGAALWSRAARWVVYVWVALTVGVIWYRVGLYRPWLHHRFFGRWILCGIVNDTPLLNHFAPRLKVPANGLWYLLPDFTAWLNGNTMYGDSFYAWYWHMATGLGGYYGLGTDLFPLSIVAGVIVWRVNREPDGKAHLRGLRLLTPRQHNRAVRPYLRRVIARVRNPSASIGIKLGASVIPASKECEHILITGSPGSGKTTAMRHLLQQVERRHEQAIVIDPEAEFVQEFYKEERGDVILNPLDERCPFWSPWLEIRDDSYVMDAEALAASLVRVPARTANEMFFRDSGRTLATSIFEVLADDQDLQLLADFLALPRDQLHARLVGTRAYAIIDPQAHDQGAGIVATVANALKACYHLPPLEQTTRSWSARAWAAQPRGWVFLPCKEDLRDAIEPLQGLWLDTLVRWLMSAPIGSAQVWIIADELPALGYQPQIEKLVTRGRKRGLAVVIGFQNVAQTRAIYGRDGAITLTSSPTTKLIMRSDEPETARWASDLIGSHETERLQMTQLAGLSTYREGVNLSPHRSVEHLVLPAEIQQLRPFHGYLCIAGEHRTTLRIPELHLTRRHPDFIPRARTPVRRAKPLVVKADDKETGRRALQLFGRGHGPGEAEA